MATTNNSQKTVSDLAVLITSCDSFGDAWNACAKCFEKYWQVNAPIYLITNELNPEYENVNTVRIGKGTCYSDGIKKALDVIDKTYVLMIMADHLPKTYIDGDKLNDLLEELKQRNVDYCSVYKQKDKERYYKAYDNSDELLAIDMKYLYAINVMPAIWKKEKLRRLTESGKYDPWEFETAFQKDSVMRAIMLESSNVYCKEQIFPICHTVVKGKYLRSGIKFLNKEKLDYDLNKRPIISRKEELKLKIVDGLSRKQKDAIKKIMVKMGKTFYTESK